MDQNSFICCKCSVPLIYEVPTNVFLDIIGLKVYWCHKCQLRNSFWPFGFTTTKAAPDKL